MLLLYPQLFLSFSRSVSLVQELNRLLFLVPSDTCFASYSLGLIHKDKLIVSKELILDTVFALNDLAIIGSML